MADHVPGEPIHPRPLICVILDDGLGTMASINEPYCKLLGYAESDMKNLPAVVFLRPQQTDPSEDQDLWDAHQQAKDNPGTQIPVSTWIPTERGASVTAVSGTTTYIPLLGGAWIEVAYEQQGPLQLKGGRRVAQLHLLSADALRRLTDAAAEQLERRVNEVINKAIANVESSQDKLGRRREREQPSATKFPKNPREFEEDLHHAFDVIGDTPDMEPTVVNVALNWYPNSLSPNTLRAGMLHHKIVPQLGRHDYAGTLKRLYNQYHHLADVAAVVAIGMGCHGVHMHLGHIARSMLPT